MPFLVWHSSLGSSVSVRSPVPAIVVELVGDFPEVPSDHQLSVHHLHHLQRA